MPVLPYSVEIHDSKLARIERRGSNVHISLSPAYIHRDGKGWNQEVEIIVHEAVLNFGGVSMPTTLSDGFMQTMLGPYHNLFMIPFEVSGPVVLELEDIDGAKIHVKGNGVSHQFKGEAVFVEDYPCT